MELQTVLDGELDEAIAPVVALLRREGFETVGSCQGGEGHGSPVPFVSIMPKHQDTLPLMAEVYSLAIILHDAGLKGFDIGIRYHVGAGSGESRAAGVARPVDDWTIFVEWWTPDIVRVWATEHKSGEHGQS